MERGDAMYTVSYIIKNPNEEKESRHEDVYDDIDISTVRESLVNRGAKSIKITAVSPGTYAYENTRR